MILTCNECSAGFSFDENLLKETGSKVRCSKCKSVFTAYPPSSADTESSAETSNDDGIDLKNINLEEIEGILGMDDDPNAGGATTKESGDLDFDFSADEDKGEIALESTLEVEKTEELDLSDMDNILKEDGSPEGTLSLDLSDMDNILKEEGESSIEEDSGFDAGLEVEKTEELDLSDMDNILEAEDEETLVSESADEENFDLELDFDSEDKEVVSDSEPVPETEETEDLDLSDFENILEEDKEPEAESVSPDEPAGLDLDFDIDESSDEAGSDFEMEETVNLDLSDMENILKAEDEPTLVGESADEENFDLELDFGSEDKEAVSDSEPVLEKEETEDLDLSDFENILEEDKEPEAESVSPDEPAGLDLDFDIDESSDEAGSDLELEETAELDLSDMDNALEIEDEESKSVESAADEDPGFALDLDLEDEKGQDDKIAQSTVAEAEVSDDLDFDLDLDMDEDEGADSVESEIGPELELEEIEELGLSDMDEGTGVIEKQATVDAHDEKADELDFALDLGDVEDDDTDHGSLAVELGDAEEFDLSDLDSILDEEDKQVKRDISTEEPEEIELDIEDDIVDDLDDKASEIQLESTEKFDLSDIDQMIDTDETAKAQDIESDEVELDFEIDGDAQDFLAEDETIEKQTVLETEEKLDETFDMGALKDESEATDVDVVADARKPKAGIRSKKPAGKKLSKPMRILLILVLLIGGAYGASEILKTMGINISVRDAITEIPFVGDLIKPDVKDVGNLNVNIFERTVSGQFVNNTKIGTLFVVTGKIKNEYQHSRRFIRMTGKIFKKGRTLVKSETVYCGNILSEAELKSLNKVLMTKRLKNRFGDKRINMKVNKGQVLPFMIVFSNVPSGLEEYSVQVAGSEKT